ncbi:MAG: hypothetical protein GEV28_20035 [Actinophytocola sp.]|uniref:hypothetical protein n=1 Tax=Actinophytocola sp. TaxID=1872138 RepID=UPI0013274A4A|nr:hypothetical protein [Actinophytocola sp.]MPZ82563.1 hypothetical protein [Actinophytocola sp.]
MLDTGPVALADTVEAARATGLVTDAGDLIVFVRNLLPRPRVVAVSFWCWLLGSVLAGATAALASTELERMRVEFARLATTRDPAATDETIDRVATASVLVAMVALAYAVFVSTAVTDALLGDLRVAVSAGRRWRTRRWFSSRWSACTCAAPGRRSAARAAVRAGSTSGWGA